MNVNQNLRDHDRRLREAMGQRAQKIEDVIVAAKLSNVSYRLMHETAGRTTYVIEQKGKEGSHAGQIATVTYKSHWDRNWEVKSRRGSFKRQGQYEGSRTYSKADSVIKALFEHAQGLDREQLDRVRREAALAALSEAANEKFRALRRRWVPSDYQKASAFDKAAAGNTEELDRLLRRAAIYTRHSNKVRDARDAIVNRNAKELGLRG